MFKVEIQTPRKKRRELAKTSLVDALLPFVFGCQSALPEVAQRLLGDFSGLDSRSRERVPVELIGVEPTTSSLQSWRSTN